MALYKRGDKYVLHRVISVIDGGYIIRGDNCYSDEKIPESAVFGVLKEYFRKTDISIAPPTKNIFGMRKGG